MPYSLQGILGVLESEFENTNTINVNHNDPAHWPEKLSISENEPITISGSYHTY